jgi:hypothetical protein
VADTQVPLWVAILGSFGIGSFVGGLVTQYISDRRRHQEWINDNKKTEWRELIDALHESIRVLASRYTDNPHDQEAFRRGEVVIGNRIFISKAVQESGLIEQWVELRKKRGEGLELAAHKFQSDLIRFSRKDLGIDSK